MRLRTSLPWRTILAGMVLLGIVPSADAAFKLRLTAGSTSVTITDGDSNDLDKTKAGSIRYSNSTFGGNEGFDIAVTVGTSNRLTGTTIARISLGSLELANLSSSAQTLTLELTDTDFDFPTPPPLIVFSSASSTVTTPNGPSTVTFQSFADAGNAEFGTSFDVDPIVMKYAASEYSVSKSGNQSRGQFFPGDDAIYSLTSRFTLDLAGLANVNSTGSKTEVATPEPPTLTMAGTGMLLLGGGYWRRRRLKSRV